MTYDKLKEKVRQMPSVNAKPMFGYECFSINGKFFVGFNKKNDHQVIIRLSKDEQQKAVKVKGIKPFSHGAKAGWIEINTEHVSNATALKWIKKGYEHILQLT
jgi:predicted DNA-binding protein (MmcQ/YjbR family)